MYEMEGVIPQDDTSHFIDEEETRPTYDCIFQSVGDLRLEILKWKEIGSEMEDTIFPQKERISL